MKTILLIIIGLSLSMAEKFPRFTKLNGVVRDSKTTLEWQDDYNDNSNIIKFTHWKDAIDYCEGLSLNGQIDWRLPNKKELLSIVKYDSFNPSISSVFERSVASNYWSSTTYVRYTNAAWVVNFYYGYTSNYHKSYYQYVRCVRAGE